MEVGPLLRVALCKTCKNELLVEFVLIAYFVIIIFPTSGYEAIFLICRYIHLFTYLVHLFLL